MSLPTEAVVSLSVALLLLVNQFGLRFLFGYRLGEDGIELRLFGARVSLIPYTAIREIRRSSLRETVNTTFGVLKAANRIFGQWVRLERDGARRRIVVLTPDDAALFVAEVHERMKQAAKAAGRAAERAR